MCRLRSTAALPLAALLVAIANAGCGSAGHAASGHGTVATSSSSGGARGALTVSPASGSSTATFVLSFTAPAGAVRIGATRIGFTIALTGGSGGCIGPRSVPVPPVRKGETERVSLVPSRLGGNWCRGTHVARAIEFQRPVCNPGMMCPQFVRLIGTVGETSFAVTR